jgi:hypothetical protein
VTDSAIPTVAHSCLSHIAEVGTCCAGFLVEPPFLTRHSPGSEKAFGQPPTRHLPHNSGAEISRQPSFTHSTRQPSLSHASHTLPASRHSSRSAWPCGTLSSCGSVVRSQGQSLDLRWVGRVSQPLSGAILRASKTFDNTQPINSHPPDRFTYTSNRRVCLCVEDALTLTL